MSHSKNNYKTTVTIIIIHFIDQLLIMMKMSSEQLLITYQITHKMKYSILSWKSTVIHANENSLLHFLNAYNNFTNLYYVIGYNSKYHILIY